MESKIVLKTHELMLLNKKKKIAIDATCGNGHDTLFLKDYYEEVIAIDIQPLAIKRTLEKVKDFKNVNVYLKDFNEIKDFKYANLIIFNLGFLPGSDKKIKTQDYTSSEAILKAYEILDGMLLIACYTKHEGGTLEFLNLKEALDKKNIHYTILDEFTNEEKLIVIEKSAEN